MGQSVGDDVVLALNEKDTEVDSMVNTSGCGGHQDAVVRA